MPFTTIDDRQINYVFHQHDGSVVVFVNGLTQSTKHWADYQAFLSKKGISSLSFDLPGQGQSKLPAEALNFSGLAECIAGLLDHLDIETAYFVGLSFGGTVSLQFMLHYPERVAGLITMGGFSEKDTLFTCLHQALLDALDKGGIYAIYDLLMALNFSHEWIEENNNTLQMAKMFCVANNRPEAIRFFLETIIHSENFTSQLKQLKRPVLVMCGENDVLTPRWCQEVLRANISNSKMVIMQNVCHAFTIESPKVSKQIIKWFVEEIENGSWEGDQSAWIASDEDCDIFRLFPCRRNHTRQIPVIED